jgi:hypothetical protein
MAYVIYNNDGTVLLTLPTGEVDSVSTSLDLFGQNLNNYGQYLNNNFTRLLTNFASSSANQPRSPQVGQVWFNTTLKKLTVWDGTGWKTLDGASVSDSGFSSTSTGDLWYDTVNSQLNIWDGNKFKVIGPQVSSLYGKFGLDRPATPILENDFNQEQNVAVLYSYGRPTALITTATFDMSTSSSTVYFNTSQVTEVVSGVTLLGTLDIRGDLYVRGNTVYDKNLTTYLDITSYGDTQTGSTSTNDTRIQSSNDALRTKVLPYLFSTSTFKAGSEVKVLCQYNAKISIRHFQIEDFGGVLLWRPVDNYLNSYTTINNNIVFQD